MSFSKNRIGFVFRIIFLLRFGILGRAIKPFGVNIPDDGSTKVSSPRVAVCLYGLVPRSIMYTHKSIEENIIQSLEKEGYAVDVFAHSFLLEVLSNPRSRERSQVLDSNQMFLLRYSDYVLENQTKVDEYLNFKVFERFGSAWEFQGDKTFNSLHNLLRQLYSLQEVWNIMNRYANKFKYNYTAVVLARPDCYYESSLSLRTFQLSDNTIYIPHYFNIARQLNDRFAVGTMKSSYVVSHRLESALAFSVGQKIQPLHSEALLYFHVQKHKIAPKIFPLQYCRIRAGGVISKDFCTDIEGIKKSMLH
eukprot:TRINITY_DN12964_c0_g1_i1.p1 TRINITY_DN12964_c0_g1~~TRINITY_DN12964_c0_g1_i1.p1  ORF type:complete len:306 (-),score=36.85 TRINITY_DN12964_c0_g1_i1:318-1235(-)